jgi:hypothetical protein
MVLKASKMMRPHSAASSGRAGLSVMALSAAVLNSAPRDGLAMLILLLPTIVFLE